MQPGMMLGLCITAVSLLLINRIPIGDEPDTAGFGSNNLEGTPPWYYSTMLPTLVAIAVITHCPFGSNILWHNSESAEVTRSISNDCSDD